MTSGKTQPPAADGKLALAIAEISNLCLTLGVTNDQLPIEIERVLVYHLRHFYDLGSMATEKLMWDMRQEMATLSHDLYQAKSELEVCRKEVYKLKQLLYSNK